MKRSIQRCFKIIIIIFCLIFLCIISVFQLLQMIENEIFTHLASKTFKPPFYLSRQFYDKNFTDTIPMNKLLDMNNFKFYKNCPNICTENGSPYLFAYVHSAPSNFIKRSVLRKTWASPLAQELLKLRVIFALGDPQNEHIQNQIDQESEKYHDIIQGNFVDSYHNLSYKHLMGYKWILNYCRSATFVIKADDDVFIDVFALTLYAQKHFVNLNAAPKDVLACYVLKKKSFKVIRSGKYKLTYEEFPYNTYPPYCSGIAYIVTPDVINDLYYASFKFKPFIWIDDLFVTGILTSTYSIRHSNLYEIFAFSPLLARLWLSRSLSEPSPYIIYDLHSLYSRLNIMLDLWNKTLMTWKWVKVNENEIQSLSQNKIIQL